MKLQYGGHWVNPEDFSELCDRLTVDALFRIAVALTLMRSCALEELRRRGSALVDAESPME